MLILALPVRDFYSVNKSLQSAHLSLALLPALHPPSLSIKDMSQHLLLPEKWEQSAQWSSHLRLRRTDVMSDYLHDILMSD